MIERRLTIGLTGGIGSGKSAAANFFADLGAGVVDTDAIAHELTATKGAAIAALRAAFGDTVLAHDGSMDRAAMRQQAFADARVRAQLEAILHPLIRERADARVAAALKAGAPYAVLVVPLLAESAKSGGYRERVARVAVVDCADELRIQRVMARSAMTAAAVRSIMAAQASREQRLAIADDVIDNNGTLAALKAQVAALHKNYLALK